MFPLCYTTSPAHALADYHAAAGVGRSINLLKSCSQYSSYSCTSSPADPLCLQVWAVVPTNLVEAERKGAKLVQSLAEADSPSNGTKVLVLSDTTNNGKKKANGHKEAGM